MFGYKALALLGLSSAAFALPLVGSSSSEIDVESFAGHAGVAVVDVIRVDDIFTNSMDLLLERKSHLIFKLEVTEDEAGDISLDVNGGKLYLTGDKQGQQSEDQASVIKIETISIPDTVSAVLAPVNFDEMLGYLPRGIVSAEVVIRSAVVQMDDEGVTHRVNVLMRVAQAEHHMIHDTMTPVMDVFITKPTGGAAVITKVKQHKCHKTPQIAGQVDNQSRIAQVKSFFRKLVHVVKHMDFLPLFLMYTFIFFSIFFAAYRILNYFKVFVVQEEEETREVIYTDEKFADDV